jgi:hypothetical protein
MMVVEMVVKRFRGDEEEDTAGEQAGEQAVYR